MNITIVDIDKEAHTFRLEEHIAYYRQVVWIGCHSDKVFNTICVDGFDTFQCSINYDESKGEWILTDGQMRTECPKGLLSERAKACSMCPGRCVNHHTANPTYSLRTPVSPTLVNGNPIPTKGFVLTGGERIVISIRKE